MMQKATISHSSKRSNQFISSWFTPRCQEYSGDRAVPWCWLLYNWWPLKISEQPSDIQSSHGVEKKVCLRWPWILILALLLPIVMRLHWTSGCVQAFYSGPCSDHGQWWCVFCWTRHLSLKGWPWMTSDPASSSHCSLSTFSKILVMLHNFIEKSKYPSQPADSSDGSCSYTLVNVELT